MGYMCQTPAERPVPESSWGHVWGCGELAEQVTVQPEVAEGQKGGMDNSLRK